MSEICAVCGLPKDPCVCEEIAREEQQIRIFTERRRFGKLMTVVEGIDSSNIDIKDLCTTLKTKCACGGTSKDGKIELQGNHVNKVKEILIEEGFNQSMIE